jgi:hypothetical protein
MKEYKVYGETYVLANSEDEAVEKARKLILDFNVEEIK